MRVCDKLEKQVIMKRDDRILRAGCLIWSLLNIEI